VSSHAANQKLTPLEIWVDNSDGSVEKSEADPSRMAVVMEDIKTLEGVLSKRLKLVYCRRQ
jgi:hypothetical protein